MEGLDTDIALKCTTPAFSFYVLSTRTLTSSRNSYFISHDSAISYIFSKTQTWLHAYSPGIFSICTKNIVHTNSSFSQS